MNDARFCFSRTLSARQALMVAALPGLTLFAACGGGQAAGGPKAAATTRPETLDHEDCPESGKRVDKIDTNGDGKPDIRRVFDGSGHEICRVVDVDHNGKPELYEYFDAGGNIRRREFCFNDTGVVNAIELYESGKLASRVSDATNQHRIDTWDWFDTSAPTDPKTGRPAHPTRRERDTTGNGKIDQWWTWNGDKVTISVDSNGDGQPDPESTITLGADNSPVSSVPPAAATDGGAAAPAASGAPAAQGSPSSSSSSRASSPATATALMDGGRS